MENPVKLSDDEPEEPNPEDCCGEGCSPCVWDVYRDKLKKYQDSKENAAYDLEGLGLSKLDFSYCKLVDIQEQTIDTSVYRFEAAGAIKIVPGQHLEMQIYRDDAPGEPIIRKYSPISWNKSTFDVIIKRYKEGKMSLFLNNVQIGNEVHWRGPYGSFNYVRNHHDLLLLLCVGTGIAPMIPIIRNILNDDKDETALKLFCGCSTLQSRLLLNEIKEFALFWNFSFAHFVTSNEGEPNWGEKVERRRIQESDIRSAIRKPDRTLVLICGTDEFCCDIKQIVTSMGAKYCCF